ncbi:ATPase with chaperone activity-like protein [Candidatus Sulfopaludibacter sp. SbA3]|nr:ATPase with chaperone activity-like protein [Candidatus Sulfopaludibacter sp. SbA3]
MNPSDLAITAPPEPESLQQTGLAESLVEQLIVKILYFRGDLYGQDLSRAVGLRFSVIQDIVESLKLRHHVQVKRSLGMGNVGAVFALTEAGRSRAHEYLDANQYAGPAPVPLEQYCEIVRHQKPRDGWLTREALRKAFKGMVLTEQVLSQVGPAISSANSLLIYGKPGDGKTFLVEQLNNLDTAPIYVPHAIECQGNIVQVFDPIYHQPLEEDEPSVLTVALEGSSDRRWIKCKRPFIVSGGELSLDMLDLRFNQTSRVYEAPFQLKANNGIYLVDDFGRQRATPAEVLNRWIVPMERRVDYLSFLTGGKMTAPFEAFLVFSTNLNPDDLGDEAFLRRIQYKMLLRGPAENEFTRIFEGFCSARKVPCPKGLVNRFIEKHYRRTGKPFRRCHPRDVLSHALNLMHFERLPFELTEQVLDRAFESCFLQEEEGGAVPESVIMPATVQSCGDHWGDKLAHIPTAFGTLAYVTSFRNRTSGGYYEVASVREYGETETSRTLARLHNQSFREWLNMNLEQQCRDLALHIASTEGGVARLRMDLPDISRHMVPSEASAAESQLFVNDLMTVMETVSPRPQLQAVDEKEWHAPQVHQRIA